ncbi:MAG: hypothetical protein ACO2PM_11775 [Pyrobaculum sp.]
MYSRGGVYWIGRRCRRPRRLEDGCLVDVRWRGKFRLKTQVGPYAVEPNPAAYRMAEVCCGREV